jgi:hypothetical protein
MKSSTEKTIVGSGLKDKFRLHVAVDQALLFGWSMSQLGH